MTSNNVCTSTSVYHAVGVSTCSCVRDHETHQNGILDTVLVEQMSFPCLLLQLSTNHELCFIFSITAAAETPSNITVNRVTPTATSITVSWSVPSTGAIPTGYIVHYLASGDKGSTIINSGTTTMVTITVLSTELVYEITLQTLSDMLPSAKSMTITIGSKWLPCHDSQLCRGVEVCTTTQFMPFACWSMCFL